MYIDNTSHGVPDCLPPLVAVGITSSCCGFSFQIPIPVGQLSDVWMIGLHGFWHDWHVSGHVKVTLVCHVPQLVIFLTSC